MLKNLRSLLSAIFYTIWRAMRGRPQFAHLPDSRATFLTCLLAYGFTSMLLILAGGQRFGVGAVAWGVGVLMLTACFHRQSRSKVLLASIFAAMAGYDLINLVCLLEFSSPAQEMSELATTNAVINDIINNGSLNGSLDTQSVPYAPLANALVMVGRSLSIFFIARYFHSMPAYIKASGFQPKMD